MKRINYQVRKLASSASKAASLAIVVAGVFAASPMAYAQGQCSITWGSNPVYVSNGSYLNAAGTVSVTGASPGEVFTFSLVQSGNIGILGLNVTPSGLDTWSSNSQTPVDVIGQIPSIIGGGPPPYITEVTLTARYGSVTCSQAVTIIAQVQTITFGALPNQPITAVPFKLSASASSGTVSLTSTTPKTCTVSGGVVTLVGVGPCTITATQSGNSTNPAATPVSQTFQVYPVCAGSAALIQSTYGSGTVKNFEVVFPNDELSSPGQAPGAGIAHWYRDNSKSTQPWDFDTTFETTWGPVGAASVIEDTAGNLDVIATIENGQELVQFSRSGSSWSGPTAIALDTSGTPSLIQSHSGSLEVVTPLSGGGLAHYTYDQGTKQWSMVGMPFSIGSTFTGVSLIQNSVSSGLYVVGRTNSNQLVYFTSTSTTAPFAEPGYIFANNASGTPSIVEFAPAASGQPIGLNVVAPLVAGGMGQWYWTSGLFVLAPSNTEFGSGFYLSASLIKSSDGNLEVVARSSACSLEQYWQTDPHISSWNGPTIIIP